MSSDLFNLKLLIIATVSAVLNFAGFVTVIDDDWLSLSLAALTSVAVFVVIYSFWVFAFKTIPALKNKRYIIIAWVTLSVGCSGIVAISTHWNVVALAGDELKSLSMQTTSITADTQFSKATAQSGSYQSLPPQIKALSSSVTTLADSEITSGAISGKKGKGGVSKTLLQIRDNIDKVQTSLSISAQAVEQLNAQGQACLSKLRNANTPIVAAAGIDCINQTIAGLNNQIVADQVAQTLGTITDGIILPASIKTKDQKDTIARILDGIQTQANTIADRASALKSKPVAFVSNDSPNIMLAVLVHWRSIIPPIATALAIDLLPVILLIFLVLTRRDDELEGKNVSTTTLADVERVHDDLMRIDDLRRNAAKIKPDPKEPS